jgi:hypothetical protein
VEVRSYYFGCHGIVGHAFWTSDQRPASGKAVGVNLHGPGPRTTVPWGWDIDGELAPDDPDQVEGRATVTHLDGWTAVSFWDRSVDTRKGSNSAFVFNRVLDFESAIEKSRESFPWVFDRLGFEVTEADPVTA